MKLSEAIAATEKHLDLISKAYEFTEGEKDIMRKIKEMRFRLMDGSLIEKTQIEMGISGIKFVLIIQKPTEQENEK